jgi:two-component system, chemotaxis family, protein-glutamate methylesterase/glutaminase
MIKLLIVDDSALMRRHLTGIFTQAGEFEIRTARNGVDALKQVAEFLPDVVTLDINMPDMDGLTALSHIMVESPRPVVMVSSLTEAGALATLEALELGAVDYIPKPGGTVSLNIEEISGLLVQKVRAAARARIRRSRGLSTRLQSVKEKVPAARPVAAPAAGPASGCVLVGVSTGGPRTLEEILPDFRGDFPLPIVVAQHMPSTFTGALAKRLNLLCALEVVEVCTPTLLQPGTIYIARGDADLVFSMRPRGLTALSVPTDPAFLWHPAVDRLVRSAMEHLEPSRLIGVLLTGMGNDGAEAMAELNRAGGRTIAECEETAVVFGMPAELIRKGGATKVMRPDQMSAQIADWASARKVH